MVWKSNCCAKVVKDVWRDSFSENKVVLKKLLNMPEGKSPFKKRIKSKLTKVAGTDKVYIILSSEMFKVICIINKKTLSIPASYG